VVYVAGGGCGCGECAGGLSGVMRRIEGGCVYENEVIYMMD
jgi:hypothetical protein